MAPNLAWKLLPIAAALLGSTFAQNTPLPRTGWTVSACCTQSQTAPTLAIDGSNGTRWTSAVVESPGMWFAVDLGSSQSISKILLANPNEPGDGPTGYNVLVAQSSGSYQSVATGSGTQSQTVITFPSINARYVNVTLSSASQSWWSIDELYIFPGTATTTTTTASPSPSCTTAAALDRSAWTAQGSSTNTAPSLAIDGNLNTRWTGAAAQAPGQWYALDLGSQRTFDTIILDDSNEPLDYPRGYSITVDGAVIATGAGDSSGKTKITFSAIAGRLVNITETGSANPSWWSIDEVNLYFSSCTATTKTTTTTATTTTATSPTSCAPTVTGPVALDRSSWTAQGYGTATAELAIDGDTNTAWQSGDAQHPTQWFWIDLGSAKSFNQITISNGNHAGDYGRSLVIYASTNNVNPGTIFTGPGDSSDFTAVTFNTITARYINITQVGTANPSWWSIDEINIWTTGPVCNQYTGPTLPNTTSIQRAKGIVAQMTIAEKVGYVHGSYTPQGTCVGNVQAVSRLGIPELCLEDGPSGVGDNQNNITGFPAPSVLASSWDVSLAQQFGVAIGKENRAKGFNVFLGPMMNMARQPFDGRIFEGSGEDPYLTAQMAFHEVNGIQSQNVISVIKHFLFNDQEYDRFAMDSIADDRTAHEIYGLPFYYCVQHANAAAVMCSYNRINGTYACENPLMNTLLKAEYGFTGFVVSDWGATHSTIPAGLNGLDLEMPGGGGFGASLQWAISNGLYPSARLDDQVTRILAPMISTGVYDNPGTPNPNAIAENAADLAVARQIATEGIVLLKNANNILPLHNINSIAVIGTNSDCFNNAALCQDPFQYMPSGYGSGGVYIPDSVTPLAGIRARAGSVAVNYAPGNLGSGTIIDGQYFTYNGQAGVHVDFFNGMTLSGPVVYSQVVSNININWNTASPGSGLPTTMWSARYTATLNPPESGSYFFALGSDDGARLSINGNIVVDDFTDGSFRLAYGSVTLTAGQTVTLVVEYYQNGGAAELTLAWILPSQGAWSDVKAAAQSSSVAIVTVTVPISEGTDRSTLALNGYHNLLIQFVSAINPNTIVVLNAATPVLLPWLSSIPAVILLGFPGTEGGNALASLLFGDVSFSGKLTQTWGKSASDYPANTVAQYPGTFDNSVGYEHAHYTEALNIGYRHFDLANIVPQFEFGFGLSYTTFAYSSLSVTPASIAASGTITVTFNIQNTGSTTGAEVAQLYVGFPSVAQEPPKILKGFSRTGLSAGQTSQVTLQLTPEELAWYNPVPRQWQVSAGTYQVFVGASSRDIRLTGSFTITSTASSSTLNGFGIHTTAAINVAAVPAVAVVDKNTTTTASATKSATKSAKSKSATKTKTVTKKPKHTGL